VVLQQLALLPFGCRGCQLIFFNARFSKKTSVSKK
jgi:hypothetical protein